jgi:hypothetical protein
VKKVVIFFLLSVHVQIGVAQNQYANKPFYDSFKKIYADGQKGFTATKGAALNEFSSFYFFHKVNTLLPGADSGKLSVPQVIGFPIVTYYFKAGKTLFAAKANEARLKAAIKTAWGYPLIEIEKKDTIKPSVFYKTFFYLTQDAVKNFESIFDTYLVMEKGTYILGLNINGNTDALPAPKVPTAKLAEANLDKKIKELLVSMDKLFADEKAVVLSKNQYYTEYESRSTIYGQKSKLKDYGFEVSFRFDANKQALSGPEEAKAVYEKLLAALSATGRFTFKPAVKENYRTYVIAFENVTDAWKSKVTLLLEYYDSPFLPSVSFLLTRKNN